MPNILNTPFEQNNNLSNIIKKQTNSFFNKKTLREEDNKLKHNNVTKGKNKIFLIKKITDRKKEESAEEKNKKKFINRGSEYRGVSRKGKTWQVLIMINRNKNYIGNFKSEDEAVRAYVKYEMKFHKNKDRLNYFHQGF